VIFAPVARIAPLIEAVRGAHFGNLVGKRSAIGKSGLLVRLHSHRRALTASFAFTFPDIYYRGVPAGVNVEAIFARLLYGKSKVWRLHFVVLAVVQFADAQIQCSLVQPDLNRIVTDIGQGQTALAVNPQHTSASVQFDLRIFIGPNIVGVGQRAIQRPFHPIPGPLRLDRDRS
jgi:hypothetical protein